MIYDGLKLFQIQTRVSTAVGAIHSLSYVDESIIRKSRLKDDLRKLRLTDFAASSDSNLARFGDQLHSKKETIEMPIKY